MAEVAASPVTCSEYPANWARVGSWPVARLKSAFIAANSIWRAIAPATATVTPLTARDAAPLLSWSLRTASCQGTGPPRSRFTQASTSHGSSRARPTSTSTAPAAIGNGFTGSYAYSSTRPVNPSSARPATGMSSRHQSRMAPALPPAYDTERFDHHRAHRDQRDEHGGQRHRDRDQQGEQRIGHHVGRERADVPDLHRADELPSHQEEDQPDQQPEHRPEQGLPGGDAPGGTDVRADQAQCGEPAVAPVAAEAHGGGDEDGDRHQQHHTDHDGQHDQQRRERVGLAVGPVSGDPSGAGAAGVRVSLPA